MNNVWVRNLGLPVGLILSVALAGEGTAENWPSFRGANASGLSTVGEGPTDWDVENGKNVAICTSSETKVCVNEYVPAA